MEVSQEASVVVKLGPLLAALQVVELAVVQSVVQPVVQAGLQVVETKEQKQVARLATASLHWTGR